MLIAPSTEKRELKRESIECDLVVVGGGLAGVCCAITAARAGIQVVLVQDRPVLGGNSSSEVRLWALGATSHMGNNNRWSREGGVIGEILLENVYRNPEGNPLIFDTVLLEKIVEEPNIRLLLNTAVYELDKNDPDSIAGVRAFCSQNSTIYDLSAPLFCDASGDGIVGFLAGAAFRMGAESQDEFGEKFAPDQEYGELLGHSIYFYSKDVGRPVTFVPPSFALKDITAIPRWRDFKAGEDGCKLWWIEYGGRLDTVHDCETIKWELWKIVYGVWNHIKNSGQYPGTENLTLEWVGTIPGKRESRRFEGDYILTQQDVIEQRRHPDAVSFGGWALDLHPAEGIYSPQSGCTQWHSKGVYQIPYRCMYSRNIKNLFLAGRIISASHVAFGSTRVMLTCAHNAQAVGMAAALCRKESLLPRDLSAGGKVEELQAELIRIGHFIPNVRVEDQSDPLHSAKIVASSTLALGELPASQQFVGLDRARAMLVPVQPGPMPTVTLLAKAAATTNLVIQLRGCSREDSYTPDEVLESHVVEVGGRGISKDLKRTAAAVAAREGNGKDSSTSAAKTDDVAEAISVRFSTIIETPRYLMICLMPNRGVELAISDVRVSGVLSLTHSVNKAVSKSAVQSPPTDIGIETFEFWLPERRPGGQNLAMEFDPPLRAFAADNVATDPQRPTNGVNAWVADLDDPSPWIELQWPRVRDVSRVTLYFDTDFDHALETVLMNHPERVMPFCIRDCRILDDTGRVLAEIVDNHQTRREVRFGTVSTSKIRIEMKHPSDTVPAGLFRIRVG